MAINITMKKRFEYKDLPDMATLLSEVDKIAAATTIGETMFMRQHGVKSEAEYKRKRMKKGHIMKHSHIGWNSWDATAQGTVEVCQQLTTYASAKRCELVTAQ